MVLSKLNDGCLFLKFSRLIFNFLSLYFKINLSSIVLKTWTGSYHIELFCMFHIVQTSFHGNECFIQLLCKEFRFTNDRCLFFIKKARFGRNSKQFSYTTFSKYHRTVYDFDKFNRMSDLISTFTARQKRNDGAISNILLVLAHLNFDEISVAKGTRRLNSRKSVIICSIGNIENMASALNQSQRLTAIS